MVKEIPSADKLWAGIPLPAYAKDIEDYAKAGVYIFRVTSGINIFNEKIYMIEVRNIFGFLDDFCEENTLTFTSLKKAQQRYRRLLREAKRHYKNLEQKQKRRIENHE